MKPQGHRHVLTILNAFAWLLYQRGGRYAYELVYQNLPAVLPSLPTLARKFPISPSSLQLGYPLVSYAVESLGLGKDNTPYILSGDGTAVLPVIQWEQRSNKLYGFVIPDDQLQDVNVEFHVWDTLAKLKTQFALASSIYVYILAPLCSDKHPAVCAVFPSNNKENSLTHQERWKAIFKICAKLDVKLCGVAADGDPKQLAAMRDISADGMHIYNCPAALTPARAAILSGLVCICMQDHIHLGLKLRNSLLSSARTLKLGKYIVTMKHVESLVTVHSLRELDIGLRPSEDINPKDRQNFPSLQRLWSRPVINELSKYAEYVGTAIYLELTREFVMAFLADMPALHRVYSAFRGLFFMDGWRQYIQSQHKKDKDITLGSNFITSNQYTCMSLNANSLLLLISHFRKNYPMLPLHPRLFSSQPNESLFSALRAGFGGLSHQSDFGTLDALIRIDRSMKANGIKEQYRGVIKIPVHRKQAHRFNEGGVPGSLTCENVTDEDIVVAIKKASVDAQTLLENCGIMGVNFKECLPALEIDMSDNSEDIIELSLSPELLEQMVEPDYEEEVLEEGFIVPRPERKDYVFYVCSDGTCIEVHKQQACAVFSLHTGGVCERLLRVRTMSGNKES